ncbi:hypothetical protein [Caldisphaera sp.]|uniref:hypothetical protein n=1 Tax=Caldisphaera sp. TaxID=2060322 RepID=UPI0025BE1697|nr:hypothetical protein [Caldisphaera sp.]
MEDSINVNEKDLVETEINYKGSKIIAYKLRGTSILVCPVCKLSYFYSEADLINHIIAHAKGFIEKRRGTPTRIYRKKEEY